MANEHFWAKIDKFNKKREKAPITVSRLSFPGNNTMYTGAGPDGVVQKQKPAMLDTSSGSPRIIHEGEVVRNNPNGGKTVIPNSDVRRGMYPITTKEQQATISKLDGSLEGNFRGGSIPGYAQGGMIPGYQEGGIIPPPNPAAAALLSNTQAQNTQTGFTQQQPQVSGTGLVSPQFGNQFRQQQLQQPQAQPQQQQVQQPQAQQPQQSLTDPTQQQGKPLPFDKQPLTPENMQMVVDGNEPTPSTVGEFKKKHDKKLQELWKISEGDSKIFEQLKNTMLGEIGAVQAAKQGASQQRALQQGLSPELTRLSEQQQNRQNALERGNMMNQLAQLESQAALDATDQYLQQSLISHQFEVTQTKNQINELMKQGGTQNIEAAEQLYYDLYGTEVDLDRFETTQTMGDISDLVALGMGIEETINLAKENGLMEKFNIDEDRLRKLVTPMVLAGNPMVQAQSNVDDLVAQGIYTPEMAQQVMAVMKWTMANPQGLEISNSFVVLDDNGNQVGNFKTEDEADSFITNNDGKKL